MVKPVPFSALIKSAAAVVAASLLLAAPLPASAADDSAALKELDAPTREVAERLLRNPLDEATFKQTRVMKAQGLELHSEGRFKVLPDGGLEWIQTEPFRQRIEMKGTHLVMQVEDDPAETLDMSANPALYSVADVLRGVMTADLASLSRHFTVHRLEDRGGRWELELVPRGDVLSKVVSRIVLSGRRVLEVVRLFDAAGDVTYMEVDPE